MTLLTSPFRKVRRNIKFEVHSRACFPKADRCQWQQWVDSSLTRDAIPISLASTAKVAGKVRPAGSTLQHKLTVRVLFAHEIHECAHLCAGQATGRVQGPEFDDVARGTPLHQFAAFQS